MAIQRRLGINPTSLPDTHTGILTAGKHPTVAQSTTAVRKVL